MRVKNNPFVYGEVVPDAAFVDRDDERARLIQDLAAGQKVFLISPRRYGKSSLMRHVLQRLARQGFVTVELTVSSFSSYVAFLEGYAQAIVCADRRRPRGRSWLGDVVRSVAPQVRRVERIEGGVDVEVAFPTARGKRDVARLADEVFALPGRLAEASNRPVVVALDEFQDIAAFDGGQVEQALRAAVQHQRRVGYVFAGSEPALMERMVGPRRPFYKAGPIMRLGRIPADEFAIFIERAFARSGFRPEAGLGMAVVELAGNLPYDVQRLAHETWDDVHTGGRRVVTLDDLHRTLRRLLAEQDTVFEVLWQRLTLAQRSVLRAVVLEAGAGMLAGDVRVRRRLGGPSSVQSALAALTRLELVSRGEDGRYLVIDSLLREWVARKTF